MKFGCINPPPGEELDYVELIPWLEREYPDGWVIVKGRQPHIGYCMNMMAIREGDSLEPMFSSETPVLSGDDKCGYCRHLRQDHAMPVHIACNHAMCVCFHFEEPKRS